MRIHREGYSLLLLVGAALVIVNSLLRKPWLVLGSLGLYGLLAGFFRDPPRLSPQDTEAVIAPASGKILSIERLVEPEVFRDERIRVSIFLSVFNVHVNVVPIGGTVRYVRYHPGKYLVAFHPKASEKNERQTVVIDTADGLQILIRQIAGLVARRIRTYIVEGQRVRSGDELGFIKFGSRVDIWLPASSRLAVKVGDTVRVGVTVLAKL